MPFSGTLIGTGVLRNTILKSNQCPSKPGLPSTDNVETEKDYYSLSLISLTSFFSLIMHLKGYDVICTIRVRDFKQNGSFYV